ncbi:ATP-binding protein [Peribacillus frigoritolerans]|uniref:ATP-binding protein n=1 Tax=Peribacillus frigoritolerans TaxID=450367 RepID=UPI0020792B2C|nr:ATP-binding protein [Peribacillus frigoritolerans]USK82639.1 ATP-binding protein [Peribacillus frigoritolerans]
MIKIQKSTLVPEVNPSREFLEIASDFSNPLDIVREAVSNSFDAKATEIYILFSIISERGRKKLEITIRDNGEGMDYNGLKSFFDLGNSLRRDEKSEDTSLIGEKGHGTKIYFNSEKVYLTTGTKNIKLSAVMDNPLGYLYEGEVPIVEVEETNESFNGTFIQVVGYNNNERDVFNHDRLKDYIFWFTKFGSFENEISGGTDYNNVKLFLKGVDRDNTEELTFGHKFPLESGSLEKLFDKHVADAPDYFVKKWLFEGTLRKFPDIKYQSVFYVEGNKAKRSFNNMIRRSGYTAPEGAYTVQERYGIWLSKDFIPVQRKNEWITSRGSEYTKFHAFFNCQDIKLTANRGSVDNTSGEILEEIKNTIKEIYLKITESVDWENLEYLEEQSHAYISEKKESRDFDRRKNFINSTKVAEYKNVVLREPRQEQGVFAIYHAIDLLTPELFPFEIVDYDTHAGIDVLARIKNSGVDLERSSFRFVEFKHLLKENFNHSFKRLYGIVCWKLNLKNDDTVKDVFGSIRKLKCVPKTTDKSYTQYFLEDERDPHRIEIIVLEEFLQEKLEIVFKRSKG